MTKPLRSATGAIIPVTLAMLLLAAGCDLPGKPDPDKRPIPANEVVDFGTLYEQNCSGCHGADGKMGPAPPLNDPLFLSVIPDAELLRVIGEGRRGTPMPAFAQEHGGPLTAEQVKALAEGIKPEWGKKLVAPKDGVPPYLAQGRGNVERGKEVFMRACSMCHGDSGEGMEDEAGVVNRIADPAFLALISDQALRRIVITGRPDLGMPNYAVRPDDPDFKPLKSTEISDVVALLSSWAPQRPGRARANETGGKQ
jgi:mono/diheme cytochrome c family protein